MIKEDEVRLIAHSIWQEEGCQDGRDCEQWLKAEIVWEEKQKQGATAKDIKSEPKQISKQNPKGKTTKNNPQKFGTMRS